MAKRRSKTKAKKMRAASEKKRRRAGSTRKTPNRRSRGKANGVGGRGSPEAVQKRRTARELNTALGANQVTSLDGRTAKRRARLIQELKDGRNGKALKSIDLLSHTNELLEIGETWASLKKEGVRAVKADLTDELEKISITTQKAYGFRPEAWKMLGIDIEALMPKR